MLEEGDQGGNGLKMDQSAAEGGVEEEEDM
jgi:hypothetical protein